MQPYRTSSGAPHSVYPTNSSGNSPPLYSAAVNEYDLDPMTNYSYTTDSFFYGQSAFSPSFEFEGNTGFEEYNNAGFAGTSMNEEHGNGVERPRMYRVDDDLNEAARATARATRPPSATPNGGTVWSYPRRHGSADCWPGFPNEFGGINSSPSTVSTEPPHHEVFGPGFTVNPTGPSDLTNLSATSLVPQIDPAYGSMENFVPYPLGPLVGPAFSLSAGNSPFTVTGSPSVEPQGSQPPPRRSRNRTIPGGYPCRECGKLFDQAGKRNKHLKRRHLRHLYCPICGGEFPGDGELERHIESHSRNAGRQ